MKKILVALLLVSIMMLSFATPVMANNAVVAEIVEVVEIVAEQQEITPFSEHTRNYLRISICGCNQLQFRVWSIVRGRWLTEWAYI